MTGAVAAETENNAKIFRTMLREGGNPIIGAEAHMLGVRAALPEKSDGTFDVSPDQSGVIYPYSGGLSVAKSFHDLPPHTVPKCFKDVVEGAVGSNQRFIWSMGSGSFMEGGVAHRLILRLKPARADGKVQGLVEPAAPMPLENYQAALAATQPFWSVDEPGQR